jgi:flagellar biosynthesis protein FlhB
MMILALAISAFLALVVAFVLLVLADCLQQGWQAWRDIRRELAEMDRE